MSNLVEIDRVKIIDIGGSPYMLVPKFMRREGAMIGNEVVFLKSADSNEPVLRVESVGGSNPS